MTTDLRAGTRNRQALDDSAMTEPHHMDDVFMARGVQFSLENVRSGRGGPFDRVVVKKGDELAEGVNQVTTTNDPRAHAEVLAIREACQKLCCFELVSRMGATSGQEPLLKGYSQLHLKEDN